MDLDKLKPTDKFSCPMCKRQGLSVYTEGRMKGGLRPHKAGAVARENVGGDCPGAGFSRWRPSFPQYVRMYGLADAIADMRVVHAGPDWTPEPMQPGEMQEFVLAAWPQAEKFELVGPPTGPGKGVTFSVGTRRWHFCAPDHNLSQQFTSRADAADAFYEYMKEN
jgi:hypothetical protein